MEKKYKLIAIDLQNDFASEGGKAYRPRPCVKFLTDTVFPFLQEKGVKILEIVSDYRAPRKGDRGDLCAPGTWGYESIVPSDIVEDRWIKSMNSPIWIRENIGDPDKKAGATYPDTQGFGNWLDQNLSGPDQVIPVLFGLTIDCCVLSAAQELSWRGYYPLILKEGVDHFSGEQTDKEAVLQNPIPNWAQAISWEDLRDQI